MSPRVSDACTLAIAISLLAASQQFCYAGSRPFLESLLEREMPSLCMRK